MPKGNMEMVTPTHTSEWLIQNPDLFSTRTCVNLSHGLCLWTKLSLKIKFILALFNLVVREICGFLASDLSSVLDHQILVT